VEAAAAAAEDFFHGAAEVDVDDIEAGLDEFFCARGKLLGLGAHELTADGALFVGDVEEVPIAVAIFFHRDEELIEHHFADGVRRTVAACEEAHGPVAVAGEGGLDDWEADV
jgi:hypothetical protein